MKNRIALIAGGLIALIYGWVLFYIGYQIGWESAMNNVRETGISYLCGLLWPGKVRKDER